MNWRAVLERLRAAVFPDAEAAAVVDAAERMTVDGLSRRSFLRAGLLAATVAATVDVEQLLWTPGEKTLFLPTVEEVAIYDGLLTPDWITQEALRILNNNLQIAGKMSRQYIESWDRRGTRVGESVNIRVPVRFDPKHPERGIAAPRRTVTLDQHRTAEIAMPTPADARDPQRYLRREVEPAMQHMAMKLDAAGVDVFSDLPHPSSVAHATVVTAGDVSLRGLTAYDLSEDRLRMRLDVLGGSSTRRRRRA